MSHKEVYTRDCCCSVAKLSPTLLRPHGLQPSRLLCPWDFSGKNTIVGCHFLLQGVFLTQELNPCLLLLVGRFFTTEPPGIDVYINGFNRNVSLHTWLSLLFFELITDENFYFIAHRFCTNEEGMTAQTWQESKGCLLSLMLGFWFEQMGRCWGHASNGEPRRKSSREGRCEFIWGVSESNLPEPRPNKWLVNCSIFTEHEIQSRHEGFIDNTILDNILAAQAPNLYHPRMWENLGGS